VRSRHKIHEIKSIPYLCARSLCRVAQAAQAQGESRYARGTNAFHAAEQLARRNGWTFGWKLIEVPGVGHDAAATSGSPQAVEAPGLGTGG
jgi:hypothetical protein